MSSIGIQRKDMSSIFGKTKYPIVEEKIRMIDDAFTTYDIRSFADLGGVWGVEGAYTFHALGKEGINDAALVDTHPTQSVLQRAADFGNLRVIQGNFGDEEVIRRIGNVDAVFLFDVLLHQVRPDWDQILEMYAPHVRCFIIYNQQWIGQGSAVRLLDLGEKAYFRNVPHSRWNKAYANLFSKLDEKHPHHDRPWRDVHHIWQWGITDEDLENKLLTLGFRLGHKKNCGRFGRLPNFENHAFVFVK